jgi:DNA-binding protein H-NS
MRVNVSYCASSTGGRPMQPKNSSFSNLSNEALCKLRDEIADLLNTRAEALRKQFCQLTGGGSIAVVGDDYSGGKRRGATRRKVAPKYRGPNGETWTGRGMKPRWLTKAINEGKQPSDFLIDNALKKTTPVQQTQRLHKVRGHAGASCSSLVSSSSAHNSSGSLPILAAIRQASSW